MLKNKGLVLIPLENLNNKVLFTRVINLNKKKVNWIFQTIIFQRTNTKNNLLCIIINWEITKVHLGKCKFKLNNKIKFKPNHNNNRLNKI